MKPIYKSIQDEANLRYQNKVRGEEITRLRQQLATQRTIIEALVGALRSTGVGAIITTDHDGSHSFVTYADEVGTAINWCQWCGVHRCEMDSEEIEGQCPALHDARAALAQAKGVLAGVERTTK